jgi:hypothetical protein
MNDKQAKLLLPLVNNQTWEQWEEYLKELQTQVTIRLEVEQSESVLRQLQGKAALLRTLVNLKSAVNKTMEVSRGK